MYSLQLLKIFLASLLITILMVVIGGLSQYFYYNEGAIRLITFGYHLYKNNSIENIEWVHAGHKFLVSRSEYINMMGSFDEGLKNPKLVLSQLQANNLFVDLDIYIDKNNNKLRISYKRTE